MAEETDPTKRKRIIKHVLAIVLSISGATAIYYYKRQPADWYSYGVCAIVLWVCLGRVFEFFLGLPMKTTRSSGFTSDWSSIPIENTGMRIFSLLMYLLALGGTVYVFLNLEELAAS